MARRKARAVYFDSPGVVSIREVPLAPEPPAGHFEVASTLIGISHGTEMLLFHGELPGAGAADATLSALSAPMCYPLRYGYMNVGSTPSGRRLFAFYPHQTLFHVPEEEALDLPPDVSDEDAVFLASMETAVTICQDAAPVLGESVLVAGQGIIGLLVAEILVRASMGRIVTLEPHAARRRASEALGCVALDPRADGLQQALAAATDGRGFDIAVNATADGTALEAALEALAFGGTVIEASYYGGRSVALRLGEAFHRRRLAIRSSQVSSVAPPLCGRWDKRRRLTLALEMVRRIRPSKYITHRFALERAQEAYELISTRPGATLQVVLVP